MVRKLCFMFFGSIWFSLKIYLLSCKMIRNVCCFQKWNRAWSSHFAIWRWPSSRTLRILWRGHWAFKFKFSSPLNLSFPFLYQYLIMNSLESLWSSNSTDSLQTWDNILYFRDFRIIFHNWIKSHSCNRNVGDPWNSALGHLLLEVFLGDLIHAHGFNDQLRMQVFPEF